MFKNIFFILSLFTLNAFAAIDLSPEELTQLKSNQLVKRVKKIEGQVWPEVTMISIIPYSPKENVEIYSDFDNHKNFIPDLIRCKSTKKEDGFTYIDAEMQMPWPIKNSTYTTKTSIKQNGDAYELGWTFIKGNQMKDTVGVVLFEPYENGKTLFLYKNHVIPDSNMAGLFRDRVPLDVEKAVVAIIKHLKETLDKRAESTKKI